ncbi:3'-5' exonuclease [Flammeovirga kamogawensis]|uniref:3'-5' exonuclease n=1 Tax=Flammeovirga kamogawensis TaxID=373891 RepID=A0ABX8H0T4_9BACT|nr:3'-5' exonuclease [Flammeovirga kamogawensis]MBB6462316.1 DNA polymerase III epsilon subunit-like protein [Flammeovirga kamogawensis]QWG09435.1 3'-5' exonuclease [Flammeovirga kamogawensis]TRX64951.1 3'-5' exonuclease [Flammeovirga kamogawensis]
MYLFFDTETTGLPKNWKAPMTEVDNWPRVIQLGYQLYNTNQELVKEYAQLILPDGWVVPKEKFWIDHGYSTEQNEKEGIPMPNAIQEFIQDIEKSQHIIAHNLSYDHNVLGAEMIRYNQFTRHKTNKYCTKDLTVDFCKIPGNYGKYKWPKLEELHQILFKENFDGAHDALNDVRATARCFFELLNRKEITLLK